MLTAVKEKVTLPVPLPVAIALALELWETLGEAELDLDGEAHGEGLAKVEPVCVGDRDHRTVADGDAVAHTEAERLGDNVEDSHVEAVRAAVVDAEGVGVAVATTVVVLLCVWLGVAEADNEAEPHVVGVALGVPVAPPLGEPETVALTVLLCVFAAEAEDAADSETVCVPEPQEEGLEETDGENAVEPVPRALGDVDGLPLAEAFALPVATADIVCEGVCVWLTEPEWEGEPEADPGPRLPETVTVLDPLPGGADSVTVAETQTERVPVGHDEGDTAIDREIVGEAVVEPVTVGEALVDLDTEGEAQCVEDTEEVVVAEPVRESGGVAEEEAESEGLLDAVDVPTMEPDTEGDADTEREA